MGAGVLRDWCNAHVELVGEHPRSQRYPCLRVAAVEVLGLSSIRWCGCGQHRNTFSRVHGAANALDRCQEYCVVANYVPVGLFV